MATCTYKFRRHLFDVETTYVVTGDALLIQPRDGMATSLPMNEVRSVQLQDEGRFEGVHVCSCVVRTDRRKLVIRSADYIRFGELKPQSSEYREFIRALLDTLRPFAHSVRFIKGSRLIQMTALWVLVFCTVCIIGLGVASLLTSGVPILRLLMYAMVFAAAAPGMLVVARRRRPSPFDPAQIPDEYLP